MKNKVFTYPAIVKDDDEFGYEITIPDFQNEPTLCQTSSDTEEEIYCDGVKLLELILVDYIKKHKLRKLPKPSDIHFNDLKDGELLIFVSTSKESVKRLIDKYK